MTQFFMGPSGSLARGLARRHEAWVRYASTLKGEFMVQKNLRWMASLLLAANLAGMAPGPVFAAPGGNSKGGGTTTTPIKHVVVIFQENVSFDHYFATYPMATNPRGEVKFKAKAGT